MGKLCRRRKGEVSCLTIRLTGASDASYHKVKWNPSFLLLAAAVAVTALCRQLPTRKSCSPPLHHLGDRSCQFHQSGCFGPSSEGENCGPSGHLLLGLLVEASFWWAFGPKSEAVPVGRRLFFVPSGLYFRLWPYFGII